MTLYTTSTRRASRVKSHKSASAPDSTPAAFDPAACPIIALHIFGIESLRQIGDITNNVVAGLKRQRQIEHLHRLGPRARQFPRPAPEARFR